MTKSESSFATIARKKLQEIQRAKEPLDPLDPQNQNNMEAKANWVFNKENNEFISSKSERERQQGNIRQRRYYKKTREKKGKPYIPMIDRMKGREACERMGYSEWRAEAKASLKISQDEQLTYLREKIARLEAQRAGVDLSIQDAQNKMQTHKQHLKGILALNYLTIFSHIKIKYATYTKLRISLGNIHDFFQKRSK